jgi:hypothetical protein
MLSADLGFKGWKFRPLTSESSVPFRDDETGVRNRIHEVQDIQSVLCRFGAPLVAPEQLAEQTAQTLFPDKTTGSSQGR